MFELRLLNKYKTHLDGDFSHGTFMDGSVVVETAEELEAIKIKFLTQGILRLRVATHRYIRDTVEQEPRTVEFLNPDPSKNFDAHTYARGKHIFGDGFTHYTNGYTMYYWLEARLL